MSDIERIGAVKAVVTWCPHSGSRRREKGPSGCRVEGGRPHVSARIDSQPGFPTENGYATHRLTFPRRTDSHGRPPCTSANCREPPRSAMNGFLIVLAADLWRTPFDKSAECRRRRPQRRSPSVDKGFPIPRAGAARSSSRCRSETSCLKSARSPRPVNRELGASGPRHIDVRPRPGSCSPVGRKYLFAADR